MEWLMSIGGGLGLLAVLAFLYNKFLGKKVESSQAEFKAKDNVLEFKEKELIVKQTELKAEIKAAGEAKDLTPQEIEGHWNKKK